MTKRMAAQYQLDVLRQRAVIARSQAVQGQLQRLRDAKRRELAGAFFGCHLNALLRCGAVWGEVRQGPAIGVRPVGVGDALPLDIGAQFFDCYCAACGRLNCGANSSPAWPRPTQVVRTAKVATLTTALVFATAIESVLLATESAT